MNKACITISNMFLVVFLLTSCNGSEDVSPVSIGEDYVNQQILIRVPDYSNTLKTADPISLELKYNSNNRIVFPNDYNLRVFERTSDEWIEIKQKPVERYPTDDIVLAPDREISIVQIVVVFPEIPNLEEKHLLRIYVFGDMEVNGDVVEVAAYTDVRLNP